MIPIAVIFAVVIGGIYGGLYNPTPAGAIGVFLVALYGYRPPPALVRTTRSTRCSRRRAPAA